MSWPTGYWTTVDKSFVKNSTRTRKPSRSCRSAILSGRNGAPFGMRLLCRLAPVGPGHPPWKMEVVDLLERFPQRDAKKFIEALDRPPVPNPKLRRLLDGKR